MPATPFNLVYNLSVQVDQPSLTRANAAFRGVGQGKSSTITVNTSGAVDGLNKVGGAAGVAQAALRAAQGQALALNTTLNATVAVTNQGASSLGNLATQAGLAARRFLAFSVAAGTMVRVVQGLKEGVSAAVDFELSMNKVAQVSNDTSGQIGQLKGAIAGLATSLGVSSAALADTAVTLKQAGFTIGQTKDALEALALVDLAPSFDGQKQATEGLIAAFRQFDLQSRDFKTSLSSINAVAAEFAVESADIVTAIQKAGGAFKVSAGDMKTGQTALNEFVALFTSVRDTTRESADSIATGLRTVFTRLQRQDTVSALKDLGINLRYTREEAGKLGQSNLENQFVGAYEAVRRLSEGLAGLRTTDPRYSQVVEQLGGYRQISRVIPLLQQFETAQKALNVAQAGQLSLQAAAEKRQETLAAKTAKLKEEYLDLFRKIVDSKGFQGLAGGLLTVASSFAKVLDAARPLLPLLTSLAAIKIGVSLSSIVGGFARSFAAAPGAPTTTSVRRFATGGFVPGSGNNDSEPALLMPGEFVLNKQAVARVGVPGLRDLNEGRGKLRMSRYAEGSRNPVGGVVYDDLRQQVEAQQAVVGQRLAASTYATNLANNLEKQGKGNFDPRVLAALDEECSRLVKDFQAAREALRALTVAMYAAKGERAPKLATFHDDGRGNRQVLATHDEVTSLEEANRISQSHASGQFRGAPSVSTAVPLSSGSKQYGFSGVAPGTGGAPDQRVFLGYAPGHEPGTPLPTSVVAVSGGRPPAPNPGAPVPGRAAALLGRLKSKKQDEVVDPAKYDINAALSPKDVFLANAAANRRDTSSSVAEATSAVEAARSRAASQTALPSPAQTSAVAAIPPDQRERFFALARQAIRGAEQHAKTRGPAGASAVAGGDLDDFVTEYFAQNNFGKIDPSRDPRDIAAFARTSGRQAAQAFFTKQGKGGLLSGLGDGEQAGREAAPQDAVSSLGGVDSTVNEEDKAARTRRKQLQQVKEALGGAIPQSHQEYVDAAKALGVNPSVAHQAGGVNKDSSGNITAVLAAAVKDKLGVTNDADRLAALRTEVGPDHPSALSEGRKNPLPALPAAGGGGRRPPRRPLAPPTGGAPTPPNGPNDPFELFRQKYPEEAAYQDAALAANDQHRARAQVSRGRQFERVAGNTQAAQDAQTREIRRGYAEAPGAPTGNLSERFASGSEERSRAVNAANQLRDARARFGEDFGRQTGPVYATEAEKQAALQSQRDEQARALAQEAKFAAEQSRRQESSSHQDPLVVASSSRRQRFDAAQAAQQQRQAEAQARQLAVAARANEAGGERVQVGGTTSSTGLVPTTIYGRAGDRETRTPGVVSVTNVASRGTAPTTVGDRITARAARDAAGIAGVTDPLEIKQAAIRAFQNGEGGHDVLDAVQSRLSPAQFSQVRKAAEAAGFTPSPAVQYEGIDARGRNVSGVAASREEAIAKGVYVTKSTPMVTARNAGTAVDAFGQVPVTDPYSGQTLAGPDGKPQTRNVGLLAERAKAVATQRIAERGGADNLSETTKGLVESQALVEEETKVRRELISAQENLLKLLQPQMTALERHTKAIEEAEKALKGETQVVKDKSGKLLGTKPAVDQATARGQQAPGAGGFTYRVQQQFGGYLDRAREFASNNAATRLNARLAGFTNSPSFGYAAAGIGAAGAFAANKFETAAGTADQAVGTDAGQSNFRRNKGAAGAISVGLAGAAAGFAVGGPVGAAIGAVAGAGYGLYSALQDAEKDIREAKIGNALTELGTKLSAFATGLPDLSSSTGIGNSLDTYELEARKRSVDAADHTFGGVDLKEYAEFRNKDLRKEFGPLLPSISSGLNAQATRAGRTNVGANAAGVDRLLNDLLGQGQNGRLLGITAQLRGTSPGDERRQLREAIVKGQETARIEQENRSGKTGVDQSINSFDRLTKALQASADSLSGLQQRAAALSDVFDGTISASRVSANAEALDQFGRGDRGALAPLDIVAAATGPLGERLRSAGGATNDVRASLDRVLPGVIANQGIASSDISTEVSRGLYRDLGISDPSKAPEDLQRTVAAVVAQLNHAQDGGRGLGGILSEVQVDASKFSDQLVSAMSDPIKEFGQKAARQLEENANKFIDGLTTLHQRLQTVGQLYDQLGQSRGTNFRTQLQVNAERAGRGNQALDFASVANLEQGFNTRQQRLTGGQGAGAFNPAALGPQLAQVRAQIGPAVERQQQAFRTSGGNSASFQQAAEEVLRLKDRASNLQQALKHLADTSERNAVIQEKLNRLKQEEDNRLGLAERFATASPEERARINQGFVLANGAANQGSLDGFNADQQRQIVETLRSAGGTTLTGFNGSPRADDLLRNLLGNSFGGVFRLTGDQQREQEGLRREQGSRGSTAEQALSELIKHQEDANQKFFENLRQQQTEFFARLSSLLLKNQLGDTENKIAAATARQRELQDGGGRSRELLGRVGVTTTDQLTALRGRSQQVSALRDAITSKQQAEAGIDAARSALRSQSPSLVTGGADSVVDFLRSSGVNDPAALSRISSRYHEIYNTTPFRGPGSDAPLGSPERAAYLNAAGRSALDRALTSEKFSGDGSVQTALGRVNEARRGLDGIAGVDSGRIVDVLSGQPKDAQEFMEALNNAFKDSGNKLEDFGAKLKLVTDELAALQAEAARLRAGVAPSAPAAVPAGGVVETRANGGSIFQPRGTDTVPAMLTPGEFVVNAASARANAGLLQRINSAKGGVQYRYDGGPVRSGDQTPPSSHEEFLPDGPAMPVRPQYRQEGGPIRRPSLPTTSQVVNGYVWAQDKIQKGLSWLGFAQGGVVPKYLAGGGRPDDEEPVFVVTPPDEADRLRSLGSVPSFAPDYLDQLAYRQQAVDDQRREARQRLADSRRRAPAPSRSFTVSEADRNPTGRVAQSQVERAAGAAVAARQQADAARHARGAERYELDRQSLSRLQATGGDNLSLRSRIERYRNQDIARAQRAPNADALEQQRAADTAAGNLVSGAAVRTFNRAAALANSRFRRPGDDGQRQILARNVALQGDDLEKRFAKDPALQRYVRGFATGGPVPGAGVGDTVPSLLTSGEFVLSQNATARAGVHNLQRFNAGGPVGHVSYLANGGQVTTSGAVGGGELKLSSEAVQAMTSLSSVFTQFVQQVGGFQSAAQTLSQTFNVFAGNAQALTQALSNMPRTLSVTGQHQVNVVINGAEVLAKLTPELQSLVVSEVKSQMGRVFKEQLPDAGVSFN